MITFNGETKSTRAWADAIGIHELTLRSRLESGWPLEKALTTPKQPSGWNRKTIYNKAKEAKIIAERQQRKEMRDKAKLALRKLSYQFPQGFEGWLRYKILRQAVLDLCDPKANAEDAKGFLRGNMEVIQEAGLDPSYIRRVLKTMGVEL